MYKSRQVVHKFTQVFLSPMARHRKFPPQKLLRPEKFNLSSGAQVKPSRSGLGTGWVTHRDYRLKGPYVVLSFLLLLFCVLCGIIVNSVLKSRFSIISASGFRKGKKTKNKYGPVVRAHFGQSNFSFVQQKRKQEILLILVIFTYFKVQKKREKKKMVGKIDHFLIFLILKSA